MVGERSPQEQRPGAGEHEVHMGTRGVFFSFLFFSTEFSQLALRADEMGGNVWGKVRAQAQGSLVTKGHNGLLPVNGTLL